MSELEKIVDAHLQGLAHIITDRIQKLHPANYECWIRLNPKIEYQDYGITAGGHPLLSNAELDELLKNMYLHIRNSARSNTVLRDELLS